VFLYRIGAIIFCPYSKGQRSVINFRVVENMWLIILNPISNLQPCASTEHHAIKAYYGSGGIVPHILDLGIRWRSVASFMTRPLYSRGKNP
jgi:hypothetical protein